MTDTDRRKKLFYNRAQHELREIELNCREVIAFSKQLGQLSTDINESEVNCCKIQFIKGEIKQKLKEFSSNIDEVYKLLDRKIVIIMNEIVKDQAASTGKATPRTEEFDHSIKTIRDSEQMQAERMFSDTLNPRITHLQTKIAEYQNNENHLNSRIIELRLKNQKLLEQFNRLSTASNKRINQLSAELNRQNVRNDINVEASPAKMISSPSKAKKMNQYFLDSEQDSYQQSYEPSYSSEMGSKQGKNKVLSFGCMPARLPSRQKGLLGMQNLKDNCQRLDRNDRNRRFDLLLSKLRDSQQDSTQMSNSFELNKQIGDEVSVFSPNVVQRYQI